MQAYYEREIFSVCWSSEKTVSSGKQMQASRAEERQMGMLRKSGKDKENFAEWKYVKNPSCMSKNRKYSMPYLPGIVTDSLLIVKMCMRKVKPAAGLHNKHTHTLIVFLIQ